MDNSVDYLLHLHIPKCAGTSLRASVFELLSDNLCLEFNSSDPFDIETSLKKFSLAIGRKPSARFISGHFPYGCHKVLGSDKFKYITVLRNPVDRILSAYRHMLVHNLFLLSPEEATLLVRDGLSCYINSRYGEVTLCNAQARLVSGLLTNDDLYSICPADFERIVDGIITEDFIHVGLQSDLNSTLLFLSSLYKSVSQKDIQECFLNKNIDHDSSRLLSQELIGFIASKNVYDVCILEKYSSFRSFHLRSNVNCNDEVTYFSEVLNQALLEMSSQLRVAYSL